MNYAVSTRRLTNVPEGFQALEADDDIPFLKPNIIAI